MKTATNLQMKCLNMDGFCVFVCTDISNGFAMSDKWLIHVSLYIWISLISKNKQNHFDYIQRLPTLCAWNERKKGMYWVANSYEFDSEFRTYDEMNIWPDKQAKII